MCKYRESPWLRYYAIDGSLTSQSTEPVQRSHVFRWTDNGLVADDALAVSYLAWEPRQGGSGTGANPISEADARYERTMRDEMANRLLLLRLLERSFGVAWALAISSLVFGLAHLGNAGATPLIGVLLGVELGLLFGTAYLLTRRIWLCTATHFAWNFVQGAVFSIAVSGQSGEAWLRGTLNGPTWLTGGAFGAEGSVVSVGLCLVTTGVLLNIAYQRSRRNTKAAS